MTLRLSAEDILSHLDLLDEQWLKRLDKVLARVDSPDWRERDTSISPAAKEALEGYVAALRRARDCAKTFRASLS